MPTLVLQMGHVARTRGATGTAGEQDWARAVAAATTTEMGRRETGWRLRIIDADEPDSSYRGSAFVAVHADGSVSSSAHGASYGYRTTEGRRLGESWARAYERRGWTRGFRSPNYTKGLSGYYGHRQATRVGNRAALIVEGGFMTNPTDRALMTGPGGPERMAAAIVDAVTGTTGPPPEEDDMPLTQEDLDKVYSTARRAVHDVIRDHERQPDSELRAALGAITRGELGRVVDRLIVSVEDDTRIWMCDWAAGTRWHIPNPATLTFLVEQAGIQRVEGRQHWSVVHMLRDITGDLTPAPAEENA